MSKSFSAKKLASIASKTNGKCFYCGEAGTEVDHVIAKSRGGSNRISNLVMACRKCNGSKRQKTIEEFRIHIEVKNSKYSGVINGMQAKSLMDLGVELILDPHVFWFELRGIGAEVLDE
ncbi:HNH endonuclease [Vibrio fluvialis]|uniref:HNH endonuclease n=1 Tax=Vibrio fluvialis TaxID=676 RepID=UPI00192AD8F4|nr:HNH endonuclease [Vibrio fluvialis]EKO3443743.1 HNH endonuclease [Vibrio fluvialis]MBL4278821.1 HNH endonuclease [Vibrio fluvialis]